MFCVTVLNTLFAYSQFSLFIGSLSFLSQMEYIEMCITLKDLRLDVGLNQIRGIRIWEWDSLHNSIVCQFDRLIRITFLCMSVDFQRK